MAVIVAVGDGSGNTTASFPADNGFPGTNPGWGSVGLVGNKTCVYLGNGWVITAYHTTSGALPSEVDFGGVAYTQFTGGVHQLNLPGSPSQPSDLELFRLDPSQPLPASPSFTISSSSPATNSWVAGIGNGPVDRSALTYWNSSGGTLAGSAGSTYSGYTYDTNVLGLQWGEGQVAGPSSPVDDAYGVTSAFYTTFADVNNSMQSGYGDSGGGVFSYKNGKWQLSGILIAEDSNASLPAALQTPDPTSGGVAVFGNTYTYMADLSQYSGQITQITPEPSSLALLAGGGAAFLVCRLLRARRRRGSAAE
jgi:hypothetical protein